MKSFIKFVFVILCVAGCKKVSLDDVITSLTISKRELPADGQTTVTIIATLPEKNSADRRSLIFSTDGGVFTSSGNSKFTTKAEFIGGIITATAVLRAPVKPGTIKITVQPEFDSPIKEFVWRDSIVATPSLPAIIKLEPSALGLGSNATSEVKLIGILKNSEGKFVSLGNKVLFEDFLLSGDSAKGQFGEVQALSNDSSIVSAFYGGAAHSVGTIIKLKATLLDSLGVKTRISDSIHLTINL